MKKKEKNYMWYKVRELFDKGLNKSQISKEIGIDRGVVRKYLSMSEEEFHQWINNPKHLPVKLSPYMKYVKKELTRFPYLSAAQIEDRLKEHFADLPEIHSKTVYNFVKLVREKYQIEKQGEEQHRQFEKLPELPYGEQAQVDFGEYYMQTEDSKRVKVYFFTMVLSRSRYKYVYFQDRPFTGKTTVYAHQLAFEYFCGAPKEILYDLDKVLIHDENLGDYLLSLDFSGFCKGKSFKPVFCRKSDPQSKGKIESVVKYVKYNFLRGRIFKGIDNLNRSGIEWLKRTGNGKKHSTTHKIPFQEWEIEKQHLLPLKGQEVKPSVSMNRYNVRKDNTVAFRGNFYSLPLGSYKGSQTKIYLEINTSYLNIYSDEKILLATHLISLGKGELVRNTDHGRDKSTTIAQDYAQVLELLAGNQKAVLFLENLKADKPRYYHDNYKAIKRGIKGYSKQAIDKTIEFCLENKIYNGYRFCEIAKHYHQLQDQAELVLTSKLPDKIIKPINGQESMTPEKSNINFYETIF